jgi:hypothetical protein
MIEDIENAEVLDAVYSISTVTLCVVSVLGSVIFILLKNRRKLVPSFTALRGRSKMFAFIFNIPMIVAIGIMLAITALYVAIGG